MQQTERKMRTRVVSNEAVVANLSKSRHQHFRVDDLMTAAVDAIATAYVALAMDDLVARCHRSNLPS